MATINKPSYWPAIVSGAFSIGILSVVLWGNVHTPPSNNGRPPLRTYIFRLAPGTRPLLFAKLRDYAEVFGFNVDIGASDPQDIGYNVVMKRADLEIIGGNPWEPLAFDMGYYAQPGSNVSDAVLDTLTGDLKQMIEQIPGARTLKTLQDLSGCLPSIKPCGPTY